MTTTPTDDRLKTIRAAGYRLLGIGRDGLEAVGALAWALPDQQRACCSIARQSSEDIHAWRHGATAALELANLLAEVGKAHAATLESDDVCAAERERWTPVVDLAARIAKEMTP